MTISTQTNRSIGIGNGVNKTWTYSFLIPAAANLQVSVVDTNGNITFPSLSTFSYTGIGNESGGTVTYPLVGAAIPAGYQLIIKRVIPNTQPYDIVNQAGFFPNVLEDALDWLEMQIQGLVTDAALSVKYRAGEAEPTLPALSTRKGATLAFDATTGLPVVGPTISQVSSAQAYAAAAAASASAASASAALIGASSSQANVDTTTAAKLVNWPAGVHTIVTLGYYVVGDHEYPARWNRRVGVPSHLGYFTDAGGAIWEFQGPVVTPGMFGAKGTGLLTDDDYTPYITAWSCFAANCSMFKHDANKTYLIDGTKLFNQRPTANWQNNHVYNVGDTVEDPAVASDWRCAVPHTSAAAGDMATDRAAHPTYWVGMGNAYFSPLATVTGKKGFIIDGNGSPLLIYNNFALGSSSTAIPLEFCENFIVRNLVIKSGNPNVIPNTVYTSPANLVGQGFYQVVGFYFLRLRGCKFFMVQNVEFYGGIVGLYMFRQSFGVAREASSYAAQYYIVDGLYTEDVHYPIDTSSSGSYGRIRNVKTLRAGRTWFCQNVENIHVDVANSFDAIINDIDIGCAFFDAAGNQTDVPFIRDLKIKYIVRAAGGSPRTRSGGTAIALAVTGYYQPTNTNGPCQLKNIEFDIDIENPGGVNGIAGCFAMVKAGWGPGGSAVFDHGTTRGHVIEGIKINRCAYSVGAVTSGGHLTWFYSTGVDQFGVSGTWASAADESISNCAIENVIFDNSGAGILLDVGNVQGLNIRNIWSAGALTAFNDTGGKLKAINVQTSSYRTALLAGPGYDRNPDGVITQWGQNSGNGTVITFPLAFQVVFSVQITPISSVGTGTLVEAHFSALSTTQMTVQIRQYDGATVTAPNLTFYWQVKGY